MKRMPLIGLIFFAGAGSEGKKPVRKKGFSLTELLTAVGIGAVLSGIAGVSYLKFHRNATMKAFYESGKNFEAAVETCLIRGDDDLLKCDTFQRLRFKCDICKTQTVEKNGGQTKLKIRLVAGELRSTIVYRTQNLPHLAVRIQELNGTGLSFCTVPSTDLQGNNPTPQSGIKQPIRECTTDADCKTGETCFKFMMPHWDGTLPWA